MNPVLKHWKKKVIFAILGVANILFLLFSFVNDYQFFVFDNEFNAHTKELYYIIKLLWFVSIGAIEYLIYLSFIHRKELLQKYGKLLAFNTIVYGFAFMCLFPGNWGGIGDELLIYWAAKHMWIWPQQGAMPGLIMIWQLMFYPATWMPILIQVVFTNIIFTRIIGKLWSRGNRATAVIGELAMFSAVAVIYTYNPMRMWLLTVSFLAFLAEYYFAWHEKSFSRPRQMYMCFLLCIIVCIRTETKYMLVWAPIVFIVLFKHCQMDGKKAIIKIEIITLFAVCGLNFIFNNLGGIAYKYNSLSVVSFVCPLSEILASDDANLTGLEKEIAEIDKVFPVQDLIDNPSSIHFWNFQHWIDNYEDASEAEIFAFERATFKVICKNLSIYAKSRWKMFKACVPNGGINASRSIDEIKVWCEANHSTSANLYHDFDYGNPLRTDCSHFLSGSTYMPLTIRKIQYSFIIPIMMLIISFVIGVIKGKKEIILILLTAGIEFMFMFFLIPSAAYMYYVPFYILGWAMLGGGIDLVKHSIFVKR